LIYELQIVTMTQGLYSFSEQTESTWKEHSEVGTGRKTSETIERGTGEWSMGQEQ